LAFGGNTSSIQAWNTITINNPVVNSSASYWLAIQPLGTGMVMGGDIFMGSYLTQNTGNIYSYGGSGTTNTGYLGMYLEFCPSGATITSTPTPTITFIDTSTETQTGTFTTTPIGTPTPTFTQTKTWTPISTGTLSPPTPVCNQGIEWGSNGYETFPSPVNYSSTGGDIYYESFLTSNSGTVSIMHYFSFTGGAAVSMAIYTDNGGQPGTALGYGTNGSTVGSEWNSLTLSTPATVNAGSNYWMAVQPLGSGITFAGWTFGDTYIYKTSGSINNFSGGGVSNAGMVAIYADLCPSGATNTPTPGTPTPAITSTATAVTSATSTTVSSLCNPTSASICVSSDDYSVVYVGGTLIGTFPYAGAPGTSNAAYPTCMSVPIALLTGSEVCLAVETQNTNPENTYSAWDLDITCAGGGHSEITNSGTGISVDYVGVGNPAPAPANDGSGNPWYNPNYAGVSFTTSYCSSGVTASIWANALFNPATGTALPFISNNCSGDYSTSNNSGALFWRQCTTIPNPQSLLSAPNITLSTTQTSAVTNLGQNAVTILYNINLCNSGGAITNGSTTLALNFPVNTSNCNAFQFVCWGYGDAFQPYSMCYYSSSNGNGNEPSVNGNELIFPSLGSGCLTITAQVVDYFAPVTCCQTLVSQAAVTWPGGTTASNSVSFITTCNTSVTSTPTVTPTMTVTPTATIIVTSVPSVVFTTVKYCPSDPPTTYTTIATTYGPLAPGTGNCGFPGGSYDPNYYAAINSSDYENGLACGACIAAQNVTNGGSVTVMVVDSCPSCSTAHQLDLGPAAWNTLTSNAMPGIANITWNFVPCPLSMMTGNTSGNIEYEWKSGCSSSYDPIQFLDPLFPITSVSFSSTISGPYTPLVLGANGVGGNEYWGTTNGSLNGTSASIYFDVTDARGDSVTIGPLNVGACGQTFGTGAQFPGCAGGANTPTLTATPTVTPTATINTSTSLTILNPTLSSPGEPVTVVLNYCPDPYNDMQLVIQVNDIATVSSPSTINQCSVSVQGSYLWVDANGTQQQDSYFTPSGSEASYDMNDHGKACGPVTFIETIPNGSYGGTYDVVVEGAASYYTCGQAANLYAYAQVSVNPAPAAIISLTKSTLNPTSNYMGSGGLTFVVNVCASSSGGTGNAVTVTDQENNFGMLSYTGPYGPWLEVIGGQPVTFSELSAIPPTFVINNLPAGYCAPLTFTYTDYLQATPCVVMSDAAVAQWPGSGPVTSNTISVTTSCGTSTPTPTPTFTLTTTPTMTVTPTPVLETSVWSYSMGGPVSYSSPAIGSDGTIYIGSQDNNLYAINSTGTFKWKYPTNGVINSSPAIGNDGTIYVGSYDNNLYAINPNGTLKWSYPTGAMVTSSPAIGSDGTIYVGSWNSNLYAITPAGALSWTYKTGNQIYSSPAIGSDGTIYVGSVDYSLYAIDPTGGVKWSYATNGAIQTSPAIGNDGTVYFGNDGNTFYAVNSTGSLKWSYTFNVGFGGFSSPAIGNDGTVYFGTRNISGPVSFFALNSDSSLKWAYLASGSGNWIDSSPALSGDGTVYFGCNDGKVYALNADGTLKWSYGTGGGVNSSPAIGNNGTVYIGSSDGNLYALTGSSPLVSSAWPKFRQNILNTGLY
jgi:outer membrane protein assembly factor BamB/expansin (peptidoglycan-binding protein)